MWLNMNADGDFCPCSLAPLLVTGTSPSSARRSEEGEDSIAHPWQLGSHMQTSELTCSCVI